MAVDHAFSEAEYSTLYRHVLSAWKRSHRENALLAAELRAAEAAPLRRALGRVLRAERTAALHGAINAWARAACWVAADERQRQLSAALRAERAATKEAEARLAAALEAEEAAREQLEADPPPAASSAGQPPPLDHLVEAFRGFLTSQGPDAWAATVPMPTPHTRGGAVARAPPPRAAASPPGAAPRLGRRAEEMLSAFGA